MLCQATHFRPAQKWRAPRDGFLGKEPRKHGNGINAKFAKKDVACENRFSHMDLRELGLELFKAVEERRNTDVKRLIDEIYRREPKDGYFLKMCKGKVHITSIEDGSDGLKHVLYTGVDELRDMKEGDNWFFSSMLDICDANGYTPLDIAVRTRNYPVYTLLTDAGADIGTYQWDNNVYEQIKTWMKQEQTQLARIGICPGASSRQGKVQKILDAKLLRFIQEDANPGKIRKLIEQGADVNAIGKYRGVTRSAIEQAILVGRFKTVKLLLDAGAQIVEWVGTCNTAIGCVNAALEKARANGNLEVYNLVKQKIFEEIREK